MTCAAARSHDTFIREQTALSRPPLVPEVRLYLATEVTPLWQATQHQLESLDVPPPYWAFAWPGGQAAARYLLDNPHIVRNRRVLDFAAGSGLIGIACALAGAATVEAVDIDPVARRAMALNAEANGVRLTVREDDVLETRPTAAGLWDVIVAGDVCYEKPMAEKVLAWLRARAADGATVIMADPGRAYRPSSGLETLAEMIVPTDTDLEDRDRRATAVYRVLAEE
ncbi:class I SAM-dependent methyltransferase [Caenispirillum salinarum]|uniref:class I SAM-dependent methyltransferase n=1 Tax=Caenispirillum salinarum TaxID=859058 RepID=UPI00384F8C25